MCIRTAKRDFYVCGDRARKVTKVDLRRTEREGKRGKINGKKTRCFVAEATFAIHVGFRHVRALNRAYLYRRTTTGRLNFECD